MVGMLVINQLNYLFCFNFEETTDNNDDDDDDDDKQIPRMLRADAALTPSVPGGGPTGPPL